ncbi:Protein O-mannosyl-transferase 1 [Actinomortierella ambigua]|nr:Protein O-mannosyl-transferase 1 [Actinomortierella ambigua]
MPYSSRDQMKKGISTDSALRRRPPSGKNQPQREQGYASVEADDKRKKLISRVFSHEEEKISYLVLGGLSLLAMWTRFYKISHPDEVVFDEVHFGKFASYYLRRTYFFDVHPPLAKLMIAAMGYFLGYDGHYLFDNIGESYIKNNIPYVGLRALPAFLGAATVPLVYLSMREAGYSIVTCFMAAFFVTFDNMMVTQTRLILLDSMLVFFMMCSLYCYIRFYKTRNHVKMVGLFTVATIGAAVLYDLWNLLDIRRGLKMSEFMRHFYARAIGLILVPFVIYLFWFYVHFEVLKYSGPGDDFMSTEFQETLQGNSMINGIHIKYGDKITIRHKDTSVFLHSHLHNYPLRYDDGRVSSAGQQVTGYSHEDPNNVWQIFSDNVDNPRTGQQVMDRDVVRLLHVETSSWLLAHDVASPTMSTNEEITTYSTQADGSRHKETTFQIQLESGGNKLRTKASKFKLLHMDTKVAIWTHDQKLPEWAFGQQEVNGNKNLADSTNLWTADSSEIDANESKPVAKRSFFKKYLELQRRMFAHNSGLTASHPYMSNPIEWPFLTRGISFWTKNDTREQIYLLGNPIGVWACIAGLAIAGGISVADILSRRRGYYPLNEDSQKRFYMTVGFLVVGYVLHYLPFFLMGRKLFLHHYMPSLVLSYMILAAVHSFMFVDGLDGPISDAGPAARAPRPLQRATLTVATYVSAAIMMAIHLASFLYFAPLSYGSPLDVKGVQNRQLLSSWDFHYAK